MYMSILFQRDEVGVMPPPPGITPNFVDPPSRAHTLIIVHTIFMAISTIFIGIRVYTVVAITRYIKMDDYTIIAAWVLAIVYSILSCIRTRYGIGRHLWDVPLSMFNPNFFKWGAIAGTFYTMSIMLTKISILMLFIQFVLPGRTRIVIYIIMVLVVIYNLVAGFNWIYACQPIDKYWDITIKTGSCINWLQIAVFSGVMNTATDFAILVLPVIILRNIQIPKRQKIGIIIVLMTGGFVLVISIIRLKLAVSMASEKDLSWAMVPSESWWAVEEYLAIICACLPTMKPFLRKYGPKIIGSSYNASEGSTRRTIRATHTRHLPSRDAVDDHDGIVLEGVINKRTCINMTTSTVEAGAEPSVRDEDGSDKGLVITSSLKTDDKTF